MLAIFNNILGHSINKQRKVSRSTNFTLLQTTRTSNTSVNSLLERTTPALTKLNILCNATQLCPFLPCTICSTLLVSTRCVKSFMKINNHPCNYSSGVFLACKNFGRMHGHSFPACAFFKSGD